MPSSERSEGIQHIHYMWQQLQVVAAPALSSSCAHEIQDCQNLCTVNVKTEGRWEVQVS